MGFMRNLVKNLRGRSARSPMVALHLEQLETRTAPALIASQTPLVIPEITGGAGGDVDQLLQRAAAATSADNAIVAIVDRNGNILGVRVEAGVSTAITSNPEKLTFAIDGAVAEARTGAFFANNAAPLTSRTVQDISQSTITQREVQSDPNITDPNSTVAGPGLVAPIGIGGHFPPGIAFTPTVDLAQIELTNRDAIVSPGGQAAINEATDRFNANQAFVPAGNAMAPVLSYGDVILTNAQLADPTVQKTQGRGIGTLPGGIPLFKDGELVGGIGVFFPGTTGYASEENSSLSADYDPSKPDLSNEAEFIALAAEGGSSGLGLSVGALGGVDPVPGYDFPGGGSIQLQGVSLPIVGPGSAALGPFNLVAFAKANYGVGQGIASNGTNEPVDPLGDTFKTGIPVPTGWLVLPHAGTNISAAQVQQLIQQGIDQANLTRAQIRTPLGVPTRMVFAVADTQTGEVLGLYRMADATVFSIDVAVAKARNTAYYDNPTELNPVDQVPGIPAGASFTNRTIRYLQLPNFPEGINGAPPGPFSILNGPGVSPTTALNVGPALPASAYFGTVEGFDAFNPGTNFHAPTPRQNQNGIVFFPGSDGVYTKINGTPTLVGGWGVSGDGVDQDDVVTVGGIIGFGAPPNLTADQFSYNGVRLPYNKFPRNPLDI